MWISARVCLLSVATLATAAPQRFKKPESNYRVTLQLGDASATSATVKAGGN